jgi:predicted esterase
MLRTSTSAAVALLFLLSLVGCSSEGGGPSPAGDGNDAATTLPSGSGSWTFRGTPLASERPIEVWYHVPPGAEPDAPVVLVLHGMGRNGDGYRDAWVTPANAHGFVVLVPEFTDEHYPGSREYNLGNVFTADGQRRPEVEWSFSQIEPAFDDARVRLGLTRQRYHLYGHSAGSQFAHRFLLFVPGARASRVVLANAGWYTLPTPDEAWPYGLGLDNGEGYGAEDAVVPASHVTGFLGRDVVVLLGDQDTDPQGSGLRTSPEAQAQGPHRFARGHHYYDFTRSLAEELGVNSNWALEIVPDVGHSNARMAPRAAEVIMAAEGN